MRNKSYYIIHYLILVALQVFVLNNIHLGGWINLYLYIWFILTLPTHWDKRVVILLGFILGGNIDLLSHTYGIHAAAATFIAFLRPYALRMFFSPEELEMPKISIYSNKSAFISYTIFMIVLHNLSFFSLEAYSIRFWSAILLKTLCSATVTVLLILAFEQFNSKKR